ncbi:MAG: PH domain-containing protein [Saprospiraceae bacterium]|nr:PH domain-containing protein [Saprospiraceae bacterium]
MLFENQQIPAADLPSVASVQFQLLPPQALQLRIIGWAIFQGVLFLIGLSFVVFNELFRQLWLALLLFACWGLQALYCYWLTRKRFYREAYAIRERDLIHVKGYWRYRQLTVPYVRVQHVEIKQGPIARSLGLGSISVYTAGNSGGRLEISDIEFQEAERIKQFIAQKAGTDV